MARRNTNRGRFLPAISPCLFALFELARAGAQTQEPSQNPRADAEAGSSEINFHEVPLTFHARSDLVIVPVVVRDHQGRAIGDLRKEDFQLFDNGKPQVISKFSVEQATHQAVNEHRVPEPVAAEKSPRASPPPPRPERYTAYIFDDIHFAFEDLVRVRDAARAHFASLLSTESAGIFSTSGQTILDFTSDRDKLSASLSGLRARPIARAHSGCPDLTYYSADLIVSKHDPQALETAIQEVMECRHLTRRRDAEQIALMSAGVEWNAGNHESQISLSVLEQIIRRLAALPGTRMMVLVSPGFFTALDLERNKTEIVDLAIRANVIIGALDGRGLYALPPGGDVSNRAYIANAERLKLAYRSQDAFFQDEVLAELADGTGGTFFHNSNDLEAGFKSVAAMPEYSYTLAFSPQNPKLDGSFHFLKVTVTDDGKRSVQARRGYVAPRPQPKSAQQEIEDALYSRKEINALPVELETQVFKSGQKGVQLAVLARVNLKKLHFRSVGGRHCNDLTIAISLFDRAGNYLTGIEETLEMRFKQETLANKLDGPPVAVKTTFDVTPGSYLVRLVARDKERQLMFAKNAAVDVP